MVFRGSRRKMEERERERERERWHWAIAARRVGARGEPAFLNLCPRMPLIILICNATNPLIAHRS